MKICLKNKNKMRKNKRRIWKKYKKKNMPEEDKLKKGA